MSGSNTATVGLVAVLVAWAALSALRGTADRRWAEVRAAVAAHVEAERTRGETGPPMWTWDVGRKGPVPLPPEAEVVRGGEGSFAVEMVVVPEGATPQTSVPLWAVVSGVPAWLFHGAFGLASLGFGALALGLRAR